MPKIIVFQSIKIYLITKVAGTTKKNYQYYKIYQDTIKYWKTKFPNFIQDIKYEDIINNSDETIRKLINLCNLEWDDNCLNFYDKLQ